MNEYNILYIGLSAHKDFFKVAIKKLARQFESKYPNATLHFSMTLVLVFIGFIDY